jgi:Mg2+/citrate symporter
MFLSFLAILGSLFLGVIDFPESLDYWMVLGHLLGRVSPEGPGTVLACVMHGHDLGEHYAFSVYYPMVKLALYFHGDHPYWDIGCP